MSSKTYKPLDKLIDESGLKINVIAERMGIVPSMLWKLRVEPNKMNVTQMETFASIVGVKFIDIYNLSKKFEQEVDFNATDKSA